MPNLLAFFRSAPVQEFSGTVYRICVGRYGGSVVSMRGSFLHGARYNVRGYFGAMYTSLSKEIARREIAQYFTAPPIDGFVEASFRLRLNRVVDLTNRMLLRKARIKWDELIHAGYSVTQEVGLRAWESGIEGLLAPSAVNPSAHNLVVFLDNQRPLWLVQLTGIVTHASLSA